MRGVSQRTEDLPARSRQVRRLSDSLPNGTTIPNSTTCRSGTWLGDALFGETTAHLASLGHRLKIGTIADVSVIAAPPSAKSRQGGRYPEMLRTKKGNWQHFGMKAYVGVDAETTAAN